MDFAESALAEIKPVITVSLYNRPKYTKQILEALSKCELADKVDAIIRIDPSEVLPEIIRLADSYPHKKHILVNPYKYGCNSAIFACLYNGFQLGDYVIHIEDDILLAKRAIRYFLEMGYIYKDKQEVFSVCGYNRDDKIKSSIDLDRHNKVESFYPWGWATWRDRWEPIKYQWPHTAHEFGQSWDLYVKKKLRGNRQCILPSVSHVKNIGAENGTHTPSKDWHTFKHTIKQWSDDF